MNSKTLVKAYQAINQQGKLNMPALTTVNWETTAITHNTPAEALAWFIAQQPLHYWAQCQQGDIAVLNGDYSELMDKGFLMNGEGFTAKQQSIAVKYNGFGGYLCTIMTLSHGGERYVCDDVFLLGTKKSPNNSHYKRIWDIQTGNTIAALFVGFEKE